MRQYQKILKWSKYQNCMVVNGNYYIFNHAAYLSKDLGEIYIYGKNCRGMEIRPTLRHLGIQ